MKNSDEWRTLLLVLTCYTLWLIVTAKADALGPWLSVPAVTLLLVLHSSLQHELLHGHPFENDLWNEALAFPALGLLIAYRRFKALHIQHHTPELLTDPNLDPESNFLEPRVFRSYPAWKQQLCAFNNTLFGRLLIGPLLSLSRFWYSELQQIQQGNRLLALDWLLHVMGCGIVFLWLLLFTDMPFIQYLLCAYMAISILHIRTFLEHRAHGSAAARSVIIEDKGLLAFLFLNNNLHYVHHSHPALAWYKLPQEYRRNKTAYLAENQGYCYASYREVFQRYFFTAKDPVAHPLMPE